MDKIIKISDLELEKFRRRGKEIGFGSEGTAYDLKDESVLKIIDEYEDESYDADYILRFSDVENDSYYFAKKVYMVGEYVRAYISKKCPGYNLFDLEPAFLNINDILDSYDYFYNDTNLLSSQGIMAFDMMYNTLYDGKRFGVIDTLWYEKSTLDKDKIMNNNISGFNLELAYLLIDGRFEVFVNQYPELKELYNAIQHCEVVDMKEFVKLLVFELSEYCDNEITYLKEAEKAVRKSEAKYYSTPHIILKKGTY